jgi:hypothetical protein
MSGRRRGGPSPSTAIVVGRDTDTHPAVAATSKKIAEPRARFIVQFLVRRPETVAPW